MKPRQNGDWKWLISRKLEPLLATVEAFYRARKDPKLLVIVCNLKANYGESASGLSEKVAGTRGKGINLFEIIGPAEYDDLPEILSFHVYRMYPKEREITHER